MIGGNVIDTIAGALNVATAWAVGYGVAIVGAVSGRVMWHVSEVRKGQRPFFGWDLLLDLPIVFGMGVVGMGVGEYFTLGPTATAAVICALSYLGPRGIEVAISRWATSKKL